MSLNCLEEFLTIVIIKNAFLSDTISAGQSGCSHPDIYIKLLQAIGPRLNAMFYGQTKWGT